MGGVGGWVGGKGRMEAGVGLGEVGMGAQTYGGVGRGKVGWGGVEWGRCVRRGDRGKVGGGWRGGGGGVEVEWGEL